MFHPWKLNRAWFRRLYNLGAVGDFFLRLSWFRILFLGVEDAIVLFYCLNMGWFNWIDWGCSAGVVYG